MIIFIQLCSVIASVFSVAWSITSYHRSVRYARDDKEKITWQGILLAFCWNLTSAGQSIFSLNMIVKTFKNDDFNYYFYCYLIT